MRIFLRRAFVAFLAMVFASSGMAWQSCLAGQFAPSQDAPAHYATVESSHVHADSGKHGHHHVDEQQSAANDINQPASDDHACVKCCSLCIVSGVTPAIALTTVNFMISSILFAASSDYFLGHTIIIDPGIPKPIV